MKLQELLNTLENVSKNIESSRPMICGGTPRDRFMGRLDNIADLDITTGDKTVHLLFQEFVNFLSKNYNVTSRVMSDGHGSLNLGNLKMDFSSNFIITNIDNVLNKMNVTNITDMKKEMFSRDFTCNALLMSLDLKNIIDPTERGFNDIKNKIIKTCLSPDVTLTTNKNRVARAIYLAAKLDFDIDKDIIKFVQQYPQTIKISTPKSLSEKINEAFEKDPDKASFLITKMNLWNYIPITELVYPYYTKQVQRGINVQK